MPRLTKITAAFSVLIPSMTLAFIQPSKPLFQTAPKQLSLLKGKETGGSESHDGGKTWESFIYTGKIRYGLGTWMDLVRIADVINKKTKEKDLPSIEHFCDLSEDLTCSETEPGSPDSDKARIFKITSRGILVDGILSPWEPAPPLNMAKILKALKRAIQFKESKAYQEQIQEELKTKKQLRVVKCHSPAKQVDTILLMFVNPFSIERLDLIETCSEEIYNEYLLSSHEGDKVAPESKIGRCLKAVLKIRDWSSTSCQVVEGSPYYPPTVYWHLKRSQ